MYGDEFVLLCEDLADLGDVEVLADRIGWRSPPRSRPPARGCGSPPASGVAFAGPGEYVSERLIAEADSAMYDAKRSGLSHQIIDLRDAVQHNESGRLSRDLRAACDEGGLQLVYSRSWTVATGGSAASRRCCGGTIPCAVRSHRLGHSRSRSRAG